jgi:TRAP-type mannitol/chloroaromatic compound transport system substrate-binding protein
MRATLMQEPLMSPHVLRRAAPLILAAAILAGCGGKRETTTGGATSPGKGGAWKMASVYPGAWPLLGTSGVYFANQLKTLSNGRLSLELTEPDKPVMAKDVFDAVSKGTVEAGWSTGSFSAARVPAAALFSSVPFGPEGVEYLAWMYQGGGLLLWRELYAKHNVVPVPCAVAPAGGGGWFLQEVGKAEAIGSLRVRMEGLDGQVFLKLGATVLDLAQEDVISALSRGVLRGAGASLPAVDEKLGFQRAAKNYYLPGWQRPAQILELLVHQPRWSELGAVDQALIEAACRDTIVQSLTQGESDQAPAVARIRTEGVQIRPWPGDALRAFKRAFDEVVKEQSAKDADFGRVWASLSRFRAAYADWKRLSRPPSGS